MKKRTIDHTDNIAPPKKKQKLDIGPYKLANKYIYLTLRENRGYFRCDSNSFRVLDVPSLN